MELSRVRRRALAAVSALALLAALSACNSERESFTGVRLTIRYESAPARLRVSGRSDGRASYGPQSLPDPERPLSQESESVVLQLPDTMAGHELVVDVVGLDSDERVIARGTLQVRVVARVLLDRSVRLEPLDDPAPSELDAGSDPDPETHSPVGDDTTQGGSEPGAQPPSAGQNATARDAGPASAGASGGPSPAAGASGAGAGAAPSAGAGAPAGGGAGGSSGSTGSGASGGAGSGAGASSGAIAPPPVMPPEDPDEDAGLPPPKVDCNSKQECKIDCDPKRASCDAVPCAAPLRCELHCKGGPTQCGFADCASATGCNGDRVVCNRPCP